MTNEKLKKFIEDCRKELTEEEASEAISIGEAAFDLLFKESADKSSTYISHYGSRKPHTLKAKSMEEAKRFIGLEPTITIIEEKYDDEQ